MVTADAPRPSRKPNMPKIGEALRRGSGSSAFSLLPEPMPEDLRSVRLGLGAVLCAWRLRAIAKMGWGNRLKAGGGALELVPGTR